MRHLLNHLEHKCKSFWTDIKILVCMTQWYASQISKLYLELSWSVKESIQSNIIDGRKFKHNVHVFSNLNKGIILGIDFLSKSSFGLNPFSTQLYWMGHSGNGPKCSVLRRLRSIQLAKKLLP